ncbi:hypothetical protein KIW84_043840 [Lathyrus oleraceus]|uniref:DUF7745 domain-containing protein n=1 Tax=Pisum sativum TaxID=3888 RepID=A0A9D4XF09_PEA|nr:hypothetical protein KIW84_043840 [Pisum sativum]
MERQRRNTKKYNFRQPDLKELRNLTSYVLDPLGFKARFGKLLPLLTTQVDEGLMSVLVQFYDPLYRCFTFPDFQLLPTLEEYAYLVGIPILDQLPFSGLESIPTSQEIADMLHIDESLIGAHMTTKGGIQGLPSQFLIAQATVYGKAMSQDAFEAIFVLLIYGLVLFPNIDKFVDVNAIRIISALNPVPTLLGDTYFSLHMRNAKGGGAIVCCLPLLYKWFISHLPQTVAFKKNKGCLRWSTRLMSLTNDDISWYNRVYDGVQIIDSCGEFSNMPLLGTCGGINYNPVLARRQFGFPLKDKPNNILLEGVFFQEGKDLQGLKARMVHAWRKVHKKGRKELGPKNCVAMEPYTAWVRKRAYEYLMPYEYPRPTPLVVAGPSTLPNQGVIDDPNDAWTSLLPQSSKFWKRKYDRLAKEKADMEAAYEREVKRLRASFLPVSRALDDYKLTHRYYTRANSSRLMDHLEQENRELKEGRDHNLALHISMNCRDNVMSNVLVDIGSSLNVLPKSTLSKLSYQGPPMRQSGVVVKAFDGSRKTVIGEVDLPIKIGPSDFQITFQVMDIHPSYNCLLGRPWIHEAGAVTSTLHQKLKFVKNKKLVVVGGEKALLVSHLSSFSYIDAEDEVGTPFQALSIAEPVEKRTPSFASYKDAKLAIECGAIAGLEKND